MSKPKSTVVNPPSGVANQREKGGGMQEPLSGSKEVKNNNHTRHNNGEG